MKTTTLAALLASLLTTASSAWAITNGGPDNGAHPYVGLAVMDDENGQPLWRCSGTLIAPRLFLTAGHCTESPAVRASIWFAEDVEAALDENGYPFGGTPHSVDGTTYVHPDYNPARFYLFDLGMIVLDEPVIQDSYASLPALGQLDPMMTRRGLQDTRFTAVGYGLQKINPVFLQGNRVRLTATLSLIDMVGVVGMPGNTAILLSNNASTGGTCFGDSGGPLFLHETTTVAAVTSYGLNGNCAGVGGGYRIDQADDLNWINNQFGELLNQ